MSWYRSGTVAVVPGEVTVTGTGTAFSANGRVGDAFQGPDGRWYEVANIASATVLSILPAYQGEAVSAGQYGLAPMQGYVKESADRLREIIAGLGSVEEDVAAAKEAAGASAASATAAQASEREAAQDRAAAEASAVAASDSQASADSHQQAAQAAAQAAQGFRDTADTYKNQAGDSATAAAASADAAKQSEQNVANKAGSGANSDITSLSGLTTALSVAQGGTGGKTQSAARDGLGLKSAATADIVGTVSQSGGVPTGTIIETGSNSNGKYTKFADGTMLGEVAGTGVNISTPMGSLFSSGDVLINLPAVFVGVPVVIPLIAGFGGTWAGQGSGSTSSVVSVRAMRASSHTGNFVISAIALGRWF